MEQTGGPGGPDLDPTQHRYLLRIKEYLLHECAELN